MLEHGTVVVELAEILVFSPSALLWSQSEPLGGRTFSILPTCMDRDIDSAELRAMTLLLFLEAPADGSGLLHFPELDPPVRIRPRAGDGVVWSNLDGSGAPSRLALHAGLAPSSGHAKVVANVWVAEKPYLRMPKR